MADPVSLAITVALNAASMAMTMLNKTEGPRLQDLSATTADFGTPLVQFYGTMRLECPCIYAEQIREEKHTSKTKSGKYAEYKYFGTWANFVADHEISGVLKFWLDRHLAYDTTGTGPISPAAALGLDTSTDLGIKFGSNLRVYLGTETQEPDPRMVATVEADEGAGRCPAYLGVAYMFFEDIPLEKFGNRFPQVSALAARDTAPKYPTETVSSPAALTATYLFSPGRRWLSLGATSIGGQIEWWDTISRSVVGKSPSPGAATGSLAASIAADGTVYQYGLVLPSSKRLWVTAPMGAPSYTVTDAPTFGFENCRVLDGSAGRYVYCASDGGWTGYMDGATHISHSQYARDFCIDEDGDPWILFQPGGSSDEFTIESPDGFTSHTFTGLVTRSGPGTAYLMKVARYSHFLVISDGKFYTIDADSWAIVASGDAAWGSAIPLNCGEQNPQLSSVWYFDTGAGDFLEYSLEDGSLLRSLSKGLWSGVTHQIWAYDSLNDAIWDRASGNATDNVIAYLNRADGSGWVLGDICADVADQCGMEPSDYDFSDLDQDIPGYAWTQGQGKDVLQVLLDLHDSDIGPHQFVQRGLKRGQPLSGDTITTDWMVPQQNEAGGHDPLYTAPCTAESQLPRRVFASFADPAMDYQPNTAQAQRNQRSVKTTKETSFDLTTYASSPEVIEPLIDRALRRAWVGATKPEFTLSPLEIRSEPGDVRMHNLDGEFLRCRMVGQTIRANRAIETNWEVDGETPATIPDWQSDVYSSLHATFTAPGGSTNGRPADTILFPDLTQGFLIDTPLLSDADDQTAPFVYVAAAPLSTGYWPGATVWASDTGDSDDSYAANWAAFTSGEGSIYGFMQSTLPSAATDVIDNGSAVEVLLPGGGALSSSTEEAILADRSLNLALIGDELVQFINADLVDTNTYQLSGLVRGARGTEYAADGHAAGERFLLIGSNIKKRDLGAGEIGDTDYYKFTNVEDLSDATAYSLEFTDAPQKPLSPAHLELQQQSSGDWLISWIRRTRIGGSSVDGQDVPLGETSESYRVKIMNGATVVNSYDVTTNEKLYTVAEQTADWGSGQSSLTVQVCQISPALSLEGFATEATS